MKLAQGFCVLHEGNALTDSIVVLPDWHSYVVVLASAYKAFCQVSHRTQGMSKGAWDKGESLGLSFNRHGALRLIQVMPLLVVMGTRESGGNWVAH